MNIVSRADWGARPARSRHGIDLPTLDLYLHHTAGALDENGNGVWWDDVAGIQRFHMDVRHWTDIAYSFLVGGGQVFEGRGVGIAGGHTRGHNSTSHAVCLIGNYDWMTPTTADLVAIAGLVKHGAEHGWWPDVITGGHRDVGQTACPGSNLYAQIPTINQMAAGLPAPPPMGDDLMALFDDEGQAMAMFIVQAYEVLLGVTLAEDKRPTLAEIAHWQNRWRAADGLTVWNEIAGSKEARGYRKRKQKVGL